MVKYRLVFNHDRCVDCGLATGRCPPHARIIARIFDQNRNSIYENEDGMIFPEEFYPQIKQAANGCPEDAIIITRVEE
jgi:ferredoxin